MTHFILIMVSGTSLHSRTIYQPAFFYVYKYIKAANLLPTTFINQVTTGYNVVTVSPLISLMYTQMWE